MLCSWRSARKPVRSVVDASVRGVPGGILMVVPASGYWGSPRPWPDLPATRTVVIICLMPGSITLRRYWRSRGWLWMLPCGSNQCAARSGPMHSPIPVREPFAG